ncbi:hypothetical protein NEOLI_000481 [Neolecta irregularis DAH-3]|uniref:Uncharacterized protein n=1 Tax=Neolecta irregularis (strain DAH-3) TaxID=1198029 RepID=A0A1U7LTV2_NEOID|nr:hypothetical protein NEOLI_000481 [Neolecta irregularis DAH-3]|eukprot:OLL26074.1 hypothetical protein NEOLI_000481 [Neolecta irregularis DAH-3]
MAIVGLSLLANVCPEDQSQISLEFEDDIFIVDKDCDYEKSQRYSPNVLREFKSVSTSPRILNDVAETPRATRQRIEYLSKRDAVAVPFTPRESGSGIGSLAIKSLVEDFVPSSGLDQELDTDAVYSTKALTSPVEDPSIIPPKKEYSPIFPCLNPESSPTCPTSSKALIEALEARGTSPKGVSSIDHASIFSQTMSFNTETTVDEVDTTTLTVRKPEGELATYYAHADVSLVFASSQSEYHLQSSILRKKSTVLEKFIPAKSIDFAIDVWFKGDSLVLSSAGLPDEKIPVDKTFREVYSDWADILETGFKNLITVIFGGSIVSSRKFSEIHAFFEIGYTLKCEVIPHQLLHYYHLTHVLAELVNNTEGSIQCLIISDYTRNPVLFKEAAVHAISNHVAVANHKLCPCLPNNIRGLITRGGLFLERKIRTISSELFTCTFGSYPPAFQSTVDIVTAYISRYYRDEANPVTRYTALSELSLDANFLRAEVPWLKDVNARGDVNFLKGDMLLWLENHIKKRALRLLENEARFPSERYLMCVDWEDVIAGFEDRVLVEIGHEHSVVPVISPDMDIVSGQ